MNETEIPRFWYSTERTASGRNSGQFNKLLTEREIEAKGFILSCNANHYRVYWYEPPTTSIEDVARLAIQYFDIEANSYHGSDRGPAFSALRSAVKRYQKR